MQRALSSLPHLERRSKPRVTVPFRATLQGADAQGLQFEVTTVLDNLSSGGLYLRLAREVRVGTRLLIDVHFNGQGDVLLEEPGLGLEVYGSVARVDTIPGGSYGVAVTFNNSVLF